MTEVKLADLAKADLRRYQDIIVVTPNDEGQLVWDSHRLPPFVGSDHAGTLVETGYVMVPSLAPEFLAPIYAKLVEIDGPRRLQR